MGPTGPSDIKISSQLPYKLWYCARMITGEDIEECFKTADKVVNRAHRGIPHDRWFVGQQDMEHFIRAYCLLLETTVELAEQHKKYVTDRVWQGKNESQ